MCSESSSQGRLLCGSPESILPLLLWDGGLVYGARVCAFYIHTCICSALDRWGQYLCVCIFKLLRVYLGTVIRQPRNKQNPCPAGYRGFLGGGTKLLRGASQCWSRRMPNRCSVGGWEFMDKEIGSLFCSMINKKCLSPTTTTWTVLAWIYFPPTSQCADELLIKLKCTGFPVTSCQHHNTQKSCFWKRKEKGIRNFESFCVCVWRWGIYTILLWFIFRSKIPVFFKKLANISQNIQYLKNCFV